MKTFRKLWRVYTVLVVVILAIVVAYLLITNKCSNGLIDTKGRCVGTGLNPPGWGK